MHTRLKAAGHNPPPLQTFSPEITCGVNPPEGNPRGSVRARTLLHGSDGVRNTGYCQFSNFHFKNVPTPCGSCLREDFLWG